MRLNSAFKGLMLCLKALQCIFI